MSVLCANQMYFRMHSYWEMINNWPEVGPILKSRVFVPKIVHEIVKKINDDVIDNFVLNDREKNDKTKIMDLWDCNI